MRYLPEILATEIVMTLFLSYIIIFAYDRRENTTFRQRALISLALVMMGGMLNSLTYYLVFEKNFLNTIIAVNISMVTMSATLLAFLWKVNTDKANRPLGRESIYTFATLLIYNEVSMGLFLYTLAFGYSSIMGNMPLSQTILEALSLGVNGYLFIMPMAAEMSIFFLLRPVKGAHRILLLSLLISAIISPTITGDFALTEPGSLLSIAVMTFFIPMLFHYGMKAHDSSQSSGEKDFLWVFPIFILMMIGVLIGSLYPGDFALRWSLYGLSMVWGMAFYFAHTFAVPSISVGGQQARHEMSTVHD